MIESILPMSAGDAEQLVHEVVSAARAHRVWLTRWHRHMLCGLPPEDDFHGAGGATLCRFGRWHAELSATDQFSSTNLRMLGELHQAVHDAGRCLALSKAEGRGIEVHSYDAFSATAEAFTRAVLSFERDLRTKLADRDPLTNVANRRSMERRLHDELERIREGDGRAWLAMIDVDRFKQINDAHGHLVGDDILRKITRHIRDQIRPYDMLFRYGGDEFLICLRDVSTSSAKAILERIRQDMREAGANMGLGAVTLSIGLYELDPELSIAHGIARADEALYDAKNSGRDRVSVLEMRE